MLLRCLEFFFLLAFHVATRSHVLDMVGNFGCLRQVAAMLPYILNGGGGFIFIFLLTISLYHDCYMSTKLELPQCMRRYRCVVMLAFYLAPLLQWRF